MLSRISTSARNAEEVERCSSRSGVLSQASYLVGDEAAGQAMVIDPRRDIQDYIEEVQRRGVRIIGVIDTHFHVNFVAGHLELQRATGTWIGDGFAAGHFDGSINVGIDGRFAETAGMVFEPATGSSSSSRPAGRPNEVALRLARIGFDDVAGNLEHGASDFPWSA